jgi:4-amino-4-deoxy-L-arabinose transferase-like glycosyltransferase
MEQVLSSSKVKAVNKNRTVTLNLSKERVFILAGAFSALLIRVFFIPQNTVINGDGIYYATLGNRLISGDISGGISAYWSPLYSLLVGIFTLFFGNVEFAGRIVSMVAGTLLIVPVYFLIRNFYGRLAAYLGTILLIVHPLLIKSSVWIMTESLYTLIFTTAILTTWSALRDGKAQTFFITGLLFGAAYLTKPEAIGFLGLLFILTIGAKFFRQKISFRRYAAGYLWLLVGFTIFFLPYIIFLHQKTGNWTISQKIMINFPAADFDGNLLKLTNDGQVTMQDRVWGDNYDTENRQSAAPPPTEQLPSAPVPSFWSRMYSTVTILGEKGIFLLKKQFRDYIPIILPYLFILVIIAGFFFKPWTRMRTAGEFYLLAFFACTLIGYALSAVELRYLFPVIPILLAWVANGIVGFSEWASKSISNLLRTDKRINPNFVRIFTLFILIVSLFPLFASQFNPDRIQYVPIEEKQAGLWIKNNSGSSPLVVMSSHGTAAFYAGAKHLFVPDEDFPTILEYARRQKVNYLIFSQRRAENTPNAFPPDTQNLPQGLRIVYQDEQSPDYKIIVYQLSS